MRNTVLTRPRSTMLLVKGHLGNCHDVRRLAAAFVTTRYCIVSDYNILWKEGMAAELLRVAKLDPAPFIVVPSIDEVEHSPGLRPEQWQAHITEGEADHHPVTFLQLRDQGPGYPLVAKEYKELPNAGARGWNAAKVPPLADPAVSYTDLAEPHIMLINMEMMHEASLSLWPHHLFSRSFYAVSFYATITFGPKAMMSAFQAPAYYMLYNTFTTYTDVIMYIYRWDPASNADYSQVSREGAWL